MHWPLVQRWLVASMCILFSGCTVWDSALRTTRFEPSLFSHKHDRRRSIAVYRRWAEEAWQVEWESAPELGDRPDYAQGFRDGLVDYTFAGGSGEPPAIPPRKLWNVLNRSEDGHQRAADWYAGYRHGARVSRDGGYRSLSTLRSSLFGFREGEGEAGGCVGPEMASELGTEPYGEPLDGETLPTPEPTPLPPSIARPKKLEDSTTSGSTNQATLGKPAEQATKPSSPDDLPAANPRDLELPEVSEAGPEPPQELKLDLKENRTAPGANPVLPPTTPAGGGAIERILLTIPEKPVAPEMPARESATPEASSSSVRFLGGPPFVDGSPTLRPVASPPTLMPVSRPIAPTPARTDGFAIRLTSATTEVSRPAPTMQRSTVEFRQISNALRSGSPTELTTLKATFVH